MIDDQTPTQVVCGKRFGRTGTCDRLIATPQPPAETHLMDNDRKVLVTWTECDCEWSTKYCDENHTKRALVSLAKLKEEA